MENICSIDFCVRNSHEKFLVSTHLRGNFDPVTGEGTDIAIIDSSVCQLADTQINSQQEVSDVIQLLIESILQRVHNQVKLWDYGSTFEYSVMNLSYHSVQ